MDRLLRVIFVEDSEDDALLLLRELRRGGYVVQDRRVETREALEAALDEQAWDLVIADYAMPHFSGPKALEVVQQRALDVPFIVVSGQMGEDTAIDMMEAGAHDYVLKGQLTRLLPAIHRELRESAIRAERRRLQDEVTISERMASLGTLAAGLAHEINNPLAVVVANLEYMKGEVAQVHAALPGDVAGALEDALEAARRMGLLVRELKVLSRPEDRESGAVDVHHVIEMALRFCDNELRHRARVRRDYGKVPRVEANEARLGQVLLNLLINAAHAIPEGNVEGNEVRVATRLMPNDFVAITVSDTGVGMTPDVVGKVFDPFFTTKPVGVGMGLGLSISHRIVASLRGELTVESRPGEGSTFTVSLPVFRPPS